MNDLLQEKLAHLPKLPGVYQHKDAKGKVLYVGKAKNLRNRVRSYFRTNKSHDRRIQLMVSKIADLEVIVTDTEAEALILENNLIKQLKPRYNINLRDDKTYPYICIKNERFPRIFPTRRVKRDGSKYFGPYTDVKTMKVMLETIRSVFKLRTCTLHLSEANIQAGKFQTCLEYHIQKCAAPCVGYETEEHYRETIAQIEKLLNGHTGALLDHLRDEMTAAAADKQFETAAEYRDRIRALEKFSSKQKIVTTDIVDRDMFALAVDEEDGTACGVMFKVREGKMIGRQHKILRQIAERPEAEIFQAFLEAYYTEATFFPDEVFLANALAAPETLANYLRERRGKKVPIRVPERGEKAELMRMLSANARLLLGEYQTQKAKREADRVPRAVQSLQRDLRLKTLPRRIECFDISHLGGTNTVASCVVFEQGRPKKSEYRKYKIRSVEDKPDDFQSMREVIERRYSKVLENNGPWPDLIVVDGGKGQLSSAVEVMKKIGFYGKAPVIGLAKRLEEIFFPGDQLAVMIPRTSSSLRLLQQVRDEAHRFAVTFQRQQRAATTLHSELMDIPGIGDKTVRKLLQHFGSVKKVKRAPAEALTPLIGPAMTQRVRQYFEEK